MNERRTSPRRRTLKAGKIVLHDGGSIIDCTVRNISEIGASIAVVNAVAIPEEFALQIDGTTQPCAVIWRRLDRLGVKFQLARPSC